MTVDTNGRRQLLAVYMSDEGTERDFVKAAKAYEEAILDNRASTEDLLCYGLLYKTRAIRGINTAHYYCERVKTYKAIKQL